METEKNSKIIRAIVSILLQIVLFGCLFILLANKYGAMQIETTDVEKTKYQIVDMNTLWDYWDDEKEPGVGNVWTTIEYESTNWKRAKGAFNEQTGRFGYFYRMEFEVDEVEEVRSIEGEIAYKDSVIVYLNGDIIFAGNVPSGGYVTNFEKGVSQATTGISEMSFNVTDLSALKSGKNILAVEIHKQSDEIADAYFHFKYFNLSESKLNEEEIDTTSAILEIGNNEEEVIVNWMTDISAYFEIEYLEERKYNGELKGFSSKAKSVLMGRVGDEKNGVYVNRGTLSYLKSNTAYLYRIKRVGSKEGSQIQRFITSNKMNTSFALLGDPQLGSYNKDDCKLWMECIEKGFNLIGKPDFTLVLGDQVDAIGTVQDTIEDFYVFRRPDIFKQIPLFLVKGNHEAMGEGQKLFDMQFKRQNESSHGDYYFTSGDFLCISINSNDIDIEAHTKFIEETIVRASRKWIIVIMHHALFSEGEHINDEEVSLNREIYADLFTKYNVDVVFSGHDHFYSRSWLMHGDKKGRDATNDGILIKKPGEVLYICTGSSSGNKFYDNFKVTGKYAEYAFTEKVPIISRVDIDDMALHIRVYRIDNGKLVDETVLRKE